MNQLYLGIIGQRRMISENVGYNFQEGDKTQLFANI